MQTTYNPNNGNKSLIIAIIIVAIIWLFCSCSILKDKEKMKENTNFKEQVETQTFRKGDTVSYKIPFVTFKDTTIYTTNRQGTVLRTVYDNNGKVSNIDCFASQIAEISKRNTELEQELKAKVSHKEEKADSTIFLYGFLIIGLVLCFGLWLVSKSLNKRIDLLAKVV